MIRKTVLGFIFMQNLSKTLCIFQPAMRLIVIFLVLMSIGSRAQSIRETNFRHLYAPEEAFTFDLHPVRSAEVWQVFYELKLRDTSLVASEFSIAWELRDGMNEKEGRSISVERVTTTSAPAFMLTGNVKLDRSDAVQFVVAKVKKGDKEWLFYTMLEPKYPVNGSLMSTRVIVDKYLPVNQQVKLSAQRTTYIAYYNDAFPAATPAFSEGAAKVSAQIKVDSSWAIAPGEKFTLPKKGLYLLQEDTTSAEGYTIRAEEDYPRLGKVESLADPLTYICTSQELARVRQAKGDKKAFDRVILSITLDQERARKFMKNYYRRVEVANQLFTSYKEGWKTDRGMVYIVFGVPDQVFKTAERELWFYKNSDFRIDFEFTKSPTLFDPENYVLIRQKKFERTVYEVIDLWRNARF